MSQTKFDIQLNVPRSYEDTVALRVWLGLGMVFLHILLYSRSEQKISRLPHCNEVFVLIQILGLDQSFDF